MLTSLVHVELLSKDSTSDFNAGGESVSKGDAMSIALVSSDHWVKCVLFNPVEGFDSYVNIVVNKTESAVLLRNGEIISGGDVDRYCGY